MGGQSNLGGFASPWYSNGVSRGVDVLAHFSIEFCEFIGPVVCIVKELCWGSKRYCCQADDERNKTHCYYVCMLAGREVEGQSMALTFSD